MDPQSIQIKGLSKQYNNVKHSLIETFYHTIQYPLMSLFHIAKSILFRFCLGFKKDHNVAKICMNPATKQSSILETLLKSSYRSQHNSSLGLDIGDALHTAFYPQM